MCYGGEKTGYKINRFNMQLVLLVAGMAPVYAGWAATGDGPFDTGLYDVESTLLTGNEIPVDGTTETVDSSTPVNSYAVRNNGTLNIIDGGVVQSAFLTDSKLVMQRGTVIHLLNIRNSNADIRESTLLSDSDFALRISPEAETNGQRGPETVITSSTISGVGGGVNLGVAGTLKLNSTRVDGADSNATAGFGVRVVAADLTVADRSYVRGDTHGLVVTYGSSSNSSLGFGNSNVTIDNSTIEGGSAAAITVGHGGVSMGDVVVDIGIQNNSTLLAGNGNLLELTDRSTARLNVDNSRLDGNLIAEESSTLNVVLQNNAQLTGNIVNSDSLAIKSAAAWTLAADNQVNTLDIRGGHISFGEGAFKTLTTQSLAGHGTFAMRIDLNKGEGDLLKVEGQATGDHRLNVRNTGAEVVSADAEPLLLVDTGGGDAQFSLMGRRADLGVYSYSLEQMGDDWFIVGSGKTISPSTQSVLALFNAAPGIWNSELSTLRSRMGEVRGKQQADSWIRAYGSRFNASTGDGVDYRNNQSGLSFGADVPLPVSIGQLNLGLMAGYSKNSLELDQGASGKIASYYLGGYATWLLEDGYYLDGVLKLNRFRNESKVAMSDGANTKGSYNSSGVGGSLEFGRHIRFGEDYFVEPYAQLTSVWVRGDRYALDNGMQASNKRTQSVVGKLGTSLGRSITLQSGGVLQPYVRVAAAQEFSRNNQVKVNTSRFDNDLSGSRAELGAGVSVKLSERLQLHADFDYMKGKRLEQPWGANVGLKLAF
jgi:outer membrane autotransporter protein